MAYLEEIITEYWLLVLFAAYTFLIIIITSFSKRINPLLNILGMNVPLLGAIACFFYRSKSLVFIATGAALLFVYATSAMWMVFARALYGAKEKYLDKEAKDRAITAAAEEAADSGNKKAASDGAKPKENDADRSENVSDERPQEYQAAEDSASDEAKTGTSGVMEDAAEPEINEPETQLEDKEETSSDVTEGIREELCDDTQVLGALPSEKRTEQEEATDSANAFTKQYVFHPDCTKIEDAADGTESKVQEEPQRHMRSRHSRRTRLPHERRGHE